MQQANWQSLLQKSKNNPQALIESLDLGKSPVQISETANQAFPMRVPDGFSKLIKEGDPNDPLLRQILPITDEDVIHPAYSHNPLAEDTTQPVPGLLHKYHGRALLITTGACAIHCRYCFRRHFPYSDANPSVNKWTKALEYLAADPAITEIILSGGDPLTLTDERLGVLVNLLAEIPHIKRLRIHSRIPVVLPERVNDELVTLLTTTRLHPVMVLHINHANELGKQAIRAIKKLRMGNIPLLNQSVLLKGINDDAKILSRLSEALFETGIMPYYLHMLDPVAGSAHFEVKEAEARQIMQELYKNLPGYLVPRLVREIPGEVSKVPVELTVR